MRIKEVLKVISAPIALASLCCLTPLVLVVIGISSVSFATSLSDNLYGNYKWVFRALGLLGLIISLVIYIRKSKRICTLDEAKRRRNEIINIVSLVFISAVLGYIFFLYVVVHYAGLPFNIWS
jgi:heme exporter protein D